MSSEDRRQLIEDEMERIAAGFEMLVMRERYMMGGTGPDGGGESRASHVTAAVEGVLAMQGSIEADGGTGPDGGGESRASHVTATVEAILAMQGSIEADGGEEDYADDTDTTNSQASTPTAASASNSAENHQENGPTMTALLLWSDPYANVDFSFDPDTTVILGPDDVLAPLAAAPPEWVAEQEREMAEVRSMSEAFTGSLPTGRHATFEYFMRVTGLTQDAPVASNEGAVNVEAADEAASEDAVDEEAADGGASSGQGLSAQEE